MKNRKAYTLMEIMITVVLIGLVAGFAIPNYTKSVNRSHERDAIVQLEAIHAANLLYYAQNNNEYLPGTNLDIAAINADLHLNIMANNITYDYTRVAANPDQYDATADFQGDFTVKIDERSISTTSVPPNPCCDTAGACPTLADC